MSVRSSVAARCQLDFQYTCFHCAFTEPDTPPVSDSLWIPRHMLGQLQIRQSCVLHAALCLQLAKIPHTHQTTPPAASAASADQHSTHRGRDRYRPSAHTTKDEAPRQLSGACVCVVHPAQLRLSLQRDAVVGHMPHPIRICMHKNQKRLGGLFNSISMHFRHTEFSESPAF